MNKIVNTKFNIEEKGFITLSDFIQSNKTNTCKKCIDKNGNILNCSITEVILEKDKQNFINNIKLFLLELNFCSNAESNKEYNIHNIIIYIYENEFQFKVTNDKVWCINSIIDVSLTNNQTSIITSLTKQILEKYNTTTIKTTSGILIGWQKAFQIQSGVEENVFQLNNDQTLNFLKSTCNEKKVIGTILYEETQYPPFLPTYPNESLVSAVYVSLIEADLLQNSGYSAFKNEFADEFGKSRTCYLNAIKDKKYPINCVDGLYFNNDSKKIFDAEQFKTPESIANVLLNNSENKIIIREFNNDNILKTIVDEKQNKYVPAAIIKQNKVTLAYVPFVRIKKRFASYVADNENLINRYVIYSKQIPNRVSWLQLLITAFFTILVIVSMQHVTGESINNNVTDVVTYLCSDNNQLQEGYVISGITQAALNDAAETVESATPEQINEILNATSSCDLDLGSNTTTTLLSQQKYVGIANPITKALTTNNQFEQGLLNFAQIGSKVCHNLPKRSEEILDSYVLLNAYRIFIDNNRHLALEGVQNITDASGNSTSNSTNYEKLSNNIPADSPLFKALFANLLVKMSNNLGVPLLTIVSAIASFIAKRTIMG